MKAIKDKGKSQRRISHADITKALGGEELTVKANNKKGPITLFSLRQYLSTHLLSTGGRPRLKGTAKERTKISLFDDDKEKLVDIVKYCKEREGINISLSQVAAVLIHELLPKLHRQTMSKTQQNVDKIT